VTVNGIMALILRYLAEFGSFLYLEVRVGCRRKKITFAIWWVSCILLWFHMVARRCTVSSRWS